MRDLTNINVPRFWRHGWNDLGGTGTLTNIDLRGTGTLTNGDGA
jgi:hypothetical protein